MSNSKKRNLSEDVQVIVVTDVRIEVTITLTDEEKQKLITSKGPEGYLPQDEVIAYYRNKMDKDPEAVLFELYGLSERDLNEDVVIGEQKIYDVEEVD